MLNDRAKQAQKDWNYNAIVFLTLRTILQFKTGFVDIKVKKFCSNFDRFYIKWLDLKFSRYVALPQWQVFVFPLKPLLNNNIKFSIRRTLNHKLNKSFKRNINVDTIEYRDVKNKMNWIFYVYLVPCTWTSINEVKRGWIHQFFSLSASYISIFVEQYHNCLDISSEKS